MASSTPSSSLRDMLQGQLSQLSGEVERLFEEARNRARRDLADQLNQAVRRIRQAGSLDELAATAVEAAGAFAGGAAIFCIREDAAHGVHIRGVSETAAEDFRELKIPLSAAAALAGAAASRDPVTAVTSGAEVSPEMATLAGHAPDGRVSLYPLVVKEQVPALLYCWEVWQVPALELLSQVAAAEWALLAQPAPSPLVSIAAAPTPASAPASPWDSLSPEEQQIHLRAQRFARVQVAQMQLDEGAAVQSGRTQRDLYSALRERIDTARATMRQSFFAPCPSMVDYLHLELVRILAHDDPELFGKDYPGPLA